MLSAGKSSIAQTAIPGGWTDEQIVVNGQRFDLLRPAHPDQFLEELEDPEVTEERDPYWGELWPTARRMAAFVLGEAWRRNTPVLELGCGIGLVGLAALKAGLDVTFSDVHEVAVRTAVENAQRNGFPTATGRVLDWRCASAPRWPLVLASDVLYERDLHAPLLATLDAVLAHDGVCWIGDPVRSTTDSFVADAKTRGYHVEILPACPVPGLANDSRFQLLRLTRHRRASTSSGSEGRCQQDSTSTLE